LKEWREEHDQAFAALKRQLTEAPVLQTFDPSKPVVLTTDASELAIGAVISQDDHPVAFHSRKLSGAELNYATHEKELLALVNWRHYLEGRHFTVIIDHLKYLHTQPTLSRRQARWMEKLAEYDFDIQYRPGKENVVADALSRLPPENSKDQINAITTVRNN